jgi:rhomboid protease GluP
MVRAEAMSYTTSLIILGFLLPGIDNYAHAGGFLGGYMAGAWLDPLKPERMDHLVGAAICLGITALAILASIVTAFWY